MPNVLFIDTACSQFSIYCSIDSKEYFEISEPGAKGHDRLVFQSLDLLVQKEPKIFSKIDYLGVCIGPGKFNSVRLACTIVATLMSLTQKPAYLCSTFDLLRMQDSDPEIQGHAVFAKKGFAYYSDKDTGQDEALKSIASLGENVHALELEDSACKQKSQTLDLRGLTKLIEKGEAKMIHRAIDLEPIYGALI